MIERQKDIKLVSLSIMASVCCGIVTYNPDIKRLQTNIASIKDQVEYIYIYDNGSKNISEIIKLCQQNKCTVRDSKANSGMAVALNSLANLAIADNYQYIVFLDQDSVAKPGMVSALMALMTEKTGIVCPAVIDRNAPNATDEHPFIANVSHTITSGSLINLEIYKKIGGYDERLFVDWVDLDYCHNLRLHNYAILRTKSATLLHELGNKEYVISLPRRGLNGHWKLRKCYRSNHAMFRQEDKVRSQTIVISKYKNTPIFKEVIMPIVSSNIADLVFEKHRFKLLKAKIRGRQSGIKCIKSAMNSSKQ